MIATLILTLAPIAMPYRVLLIIGDDIGHDLHATSPTPNLDALAAQGLVFTNCWAAPRCAGSRSRLYTGLEAWRPQNLMGWGQTESGYTLPVGSWLLPSRVTSSGKVAVLYGKLHQAEDLRDDWPLDAGFARGLWTMRNLGAGDSVGFYDWTSHDGVGSPVPQTEYATKWICDEALLDLVGNEPDLLVLALHEAHAPYDLPPANLAPISFASGTPTGDLAIARAKVEAMDTCLGPLIGTALANGLVVVYVADNGTSQALGGGKETLYESGINVPLIVAGPGFVTGTDAALVQMTDLHQTILHLMGIDGQPQADSVSFARRLTGAAVAGREFVRCDRFAPSGQAPNPAHWGRAVRDTLGWKLIDNGTQETPRYELFLLPDETLNLYPPESAEADEAFYRLLGELPG